MKQILVLQLRTYIDGLRGW